MVNKKGQEEAVGFVAIVVIVVVILVIFLSIYLRYNNNSDMKSSGDLEHFLESAMSFTTSCSLDFEPNYINLDRLLRECNRGISICTSGQNPCDIAKFTLMNLLNHSFLVGPDYPRSGYSINISFPVPENKTEEFFSFLKGECNYRYQGAEYITLSPYGREIVIDFKLCYGKPETN